MVVEINERNTQKSANQFMRYGALLTLQDLRDGAGERENITERARPSGDRPTRNTNVATVSRDTDRSTMPIGHGRTDLHAHARGSRAHVGRSFHDSM